MNDLEKARRITGDDFTAAEAFVRESYPAVYRLLRHLTGHREDAEDLAQQTFVKARLQIGSFRGRSSLLTWLLRIAYREYLQWKRTHRPTKRLVDNHSVPEAGYQALLDGEAILAALASLPDKLREAFVLHEIEEMSVVEVTRIVGVPVGTVKARIHYARRRLRTQLEEGKEEMRHEPTRITL